MNGVEIMKINDDLIVLVLEKSSFLTISRMVKWMENDCKFPNNLLKTKGKNEKQEKYGNPRKNHILVEKKYCKVKVEGEGLICLLLNLETQVFFYFPGQARKLFFLLAADSVPFKCGYNDSNFLIVIPS